MAPLSSFRGVIISWAMHSASLLLFVVLFSGISFSFASAAGFALFCVFAMGFLRFSLYGGHGAGQFMSGALLSTLWFPVTLSLLDWAVGGGISPLDYRFYANAFKYTYSYEAALFTWAPAAAVIVVDAVGCGLGTLAHRFLLYWRGRTGGGDPQ